MTLVKPKIDLERAKKVVFDVYGLNVVKITELNGYDDKNFHVVAVDGEFAEYVLKIVNTLDSQNTKAFQAQSDLLIFLNKNNIRCPKSIPTKDRKPFGTISLSSGHHIVRLLEYIPGDILYNLKNPNYDIFYQVGVLAAKIDTALQAFDHPEYRKTIQWCLGSAPDILNFIEAVDEKKRALIKNTIAEFVSRVLTIENGLVRGIIHGDINEQNLIVDTVKNQTTVKAVIDFGDTHYCCYLYELAIAMTYMIFMSNDIDAGGYVLAGYSLIRTVSQEEFNVLKICVMTRFCQSLVLGAYSNLKDPGNEYVLSTAKKGWALLEQLSSESEDVVLKRWKKIRVDCLGSD